MPLGLGVGLGLGVVLRHVGPAWTPPRLPSYHPLGLGREARRAEDGVLHREDAHVVGQQHLRQERGEGVITR